MQSFSLDPIFYKLKEELGSVVENPNREWIRVLRLTEEHPIPQVVDAIKRALAYGVYDYVRFAQRLLREPPSIKNLLLQQVQPTIMVDDKSCLCGHPKLAKVAVQQHPLTCYDALLTGGKKNE